MNPRVVVALLAGAVAGCTGESSAPDPGALSVILETTTGPAVGAIVVTISGGPVIGVHGGANLDASHTTDGSGVHVLIVGDVGIGVVATLDVPDTRAADAYVVTIDQVASDSTFALLDPAPFRARIVAPQ